MTKATPDFVHKLVFLGDSSVGKTSLVQRYVYNSLDPNIGRTIGAMLHVKMVQYEDALHKLVIWDLGGQQSFHVLREQYCAQASGAFFVVDITRPDTLESIDSWLGDLFNAAGKVPVVVVGNKADLEPAIPPDKIVQESESRGFKLITTSALENHNVNKAFTELLVEVVKKAKEKKTII